jgi:Zn-dependent protease
VSILVHELGHAFLQRHFGGHPWITLYSFGGLASCNDCDRRPRNQILILLAGPFAGFLLAAAILAGLNVSGHQAGFILASDASDIPSNLQPVPIIGKLYSYFQPPSSEPVTLIIFYALYVNILWGILNLLPIYPLDGGQISRELFSLQNPRAGTLQSLQLSAGTAVLVAAYALLNQRVFTGIMFGLLAYENFQSIQFYRSHWR